MTQDAMTFLASQISRRGMFRRLEFLNELEDDGGEEVTEEDLDEDDSSCSDASCVAEPWEQEKRCRARTPPILQNYGACFNPVLSFYVLAN